MKCGLAHASCWMPPSGSTPRVERQPRRGPRWEAPCALEGGVSTASGTRPKTGVRTAACESLSSSAGQVFTTWRSPRHQDWTSRRRAAEAGPAAPSCPAPATVRRHVRLREPALPGGTEAGAARGPTPRLG